MRVSSSFEQIQQLCEQLKTENITKGWNLHGKLQVEPAPVKVMPDIGPTPQPAIPDETTVPKAKPVRKFAASETEEVAPAKKTRKKKSG